MIYEWIKEQITNNQFFSGAIGGSLFYAGISYLRSVYTKILNPLKNLFIKNISVSSYLDTEVFNNLNLYLVKQIKNPKSLTIKKIYNRIVDENCEDESSNNEKRYIETISYGRHYYWYNFYSIIYVDVATEEHHGDTKSDIITCSIYSINATKIRKEILNYVSNTCDKQLTQAYEYYPSSDGYVFGTSKKDLTKRSLNSIFINDSIKQQILTSIHNLNNKKELYNKIGTPRILGILLYGQPGTGKSSIIKSIAYELNRSIYYVNLNSKIAAIETLIRSMKPNSILAIEDIDSYRLAQCRENNNLNEKTEDLPFLLKVLDGHGLPDNTIIIATSNYPEKLDPAIKRFGRFDLKIEIEKADRDLAEQMVEFLDPSKKHILDSLEYPVPQAEIQARILKL